MKRVTFLLYFLAVTAFAQDKTVEQKKKNTAKGQSTDESLVQSAMIYNSLQKNEATGGNTGQLRTYDLRYEGKQGTPYFIDEWLSGQLIYSNGSAATKNSLLKYDTFTKELILKRPQGDSIIIYPNQISAFSISDPSKNVNYPFTKFENLKTESGVVPVCFLMVLYKNKTSLLKYVSKSVMKANYQGGYSADRRYDSYIDNSQYFIQKADKSLVKVKIKKTSILDVLADKKEAIEAFIKNENLSFKNDIDFARVLAYYDGL